MPCSEWDNGPWRGDLQRPEKLRRQQQVATRLACEYCRLLEKDGRPIPDYAQLFWEDHKRQDAQREAQEKKDREALDVRARALAKLTVTERKALGL